MHAEMSIPGDHATREKQKGIVRGVRRDMPCNSSSREIA